jgi:hypothetical protein
MNDIAQSKSPLTPRLLAKMSWQLWAVAIGIVIFTRGLSIKVPAEFFALLLICGGFLLGIVMLATIPKYGDQGILKPALLGIALTGILLSIAIPNFINARNEAIRKNEAFIKAPISSQNWQEYKIAGLQFLSPVGLAAFNPTAKEPNKNVETYMGQLVSPGLTVILHRRTLSANDEYTLESFSSEVVDLMKQKWPDNFQSSIRDTVIDGVSSKQISAQFQSPAKRISAQLQKGIPIINDSVLIIKIQPFIWEIQVLVPKESPNGDETVEKIFNSIKLLPPDA